MPVPVIRDTKQKICNDEEWQKERDLERHKVQVIKQKMDACPLFISWGYGEAPINLEPYVNVESNGEKHKWLSCMLIIIT